MFKVIWYAQAYVNKAIWRKSGADEMNIQQWSSEKERLEEFLKTNVHVMIKSASIHMWKPNYMNML
jgi:hypothetical protein